MILAAGEDAHLQKELSHTKVLDSDQFMEIDVNSIQNNPMQPRIHIDKSELKGLVRSIKMHGLIQPIAVIRTGNDEYILKAGQRRWLAHKEIGLETIKAMP